MPTPTVQDVLVDTEFWDDGRTVELISIGLVAPVANGSGGYTGGNSTYYAVSAGFDEIPVIVDPWMRQNVWKHLPRTTRVPFGTLDLQHHDVKTRRVIADDVDDFLRQWPEVRLWAYWASHDFVALSQLWGPLRDKPACLPWRIHDLAQYADHLGADPDQFPKQPTEGQHHALRDAEWNADVLRHLRVIEGTR